MAKPAMYSFREIGHGDVMLTICKADGEFGSCMAMPAADVEKNRLALEGMGLAHATGIPEWSWRSRLGPARVAA